MDPESLKNEPKKPATNEDIMYMQARVLGKACGGDENMMMKWLSEKNYEGVSVNADHLRKVIARYLEGNDITDVNTIPEGEVSAMVELVIEGDGELKTLGETLH